MWVFTTPAIAQHVFGVEPGYTSSELFNDAGNWVGVIFGVYNAVSAFFAFFLPRIADKVGRKKTHAISLVLGGLGLISFIFITTKYMLLLSMLWVVLAWASILALPYAICACFLSANSIQYFSHLFLHHFRTKVLDNAENYLLSLNALNILLYMFNCRCFCARRPVETR